MTHQQKRRWAAAKLRALISRNSTPSNTLYHAIDARTVKAIVAAIRELEGRAR